MEELGEIKDQLRTININIEFIKEHMVDVDSLLTPEEEIKLGESLGELKKGKTFSLEAIKADRENA